MLRLSISCDRRIRHADVPTEPTVLGASPECGIQAPFPGVSRRHARVETVGAGVKVTDLGSKNGLRQKGRRHDELTLLAGDSVQIGRARLLLEEVDTSDVLLGTAPPSRKSTAASAGDGETDTVATDGLDSTPAEALRLLRAIEESGLDLASPQGQLLLERATRVLEATSLFAFTPAANGPALRHVNGAAPSDTHVNAAGLLARQSREEEVLTLLAEDGMTIMASRLGGPGEAPVLAGLLKLTQARLKPWRLDLFAYIAHRLRPSATRPAPNSQRAPAALVVPDGFVQGRSVAMTRLLDQLHAAARSSLDVLILGETGVGKEYVARIIHDSGPTAGGPFVAINCAAIPSELLEAELFGVKARVATGVDPRPGLLARAQGGCVFLDEIGDMPATLQAKLLRALQEREVMPIGGHQPEPIEVRVLSSTNKDIIAMVRASQFRPDLYYRLRGLEFVLPPLRSRHEDIPLLALAFAERAAGTHEKDISGISRRALHLLESHDWPGNVRELRSEIERAVLLCPDGGTLSSRYFESLRGPATPGSGTAVSSPPGAPGPHVPAQPAHERHDAKATLAAQVDGVEFRAITVALAATHGNQTAAARQLGITRNGLALKMKRLGIKNGA
jgi:DNA-binding NtrC family response regulator/pSer/pThr/pTyr-binding forkhead associated (FHA) protein